MMNTVRKRRTDNKSKGNAGSVKLVSVKNKQTEKKRVPLRWLKRVNKQYAVLVGLVLLAVSLPIVAYVVSSQSQTVKTEASGNNRPYFSSVSPKSGAGDTLTITTTVKDADGINTMKNVGIWMDNQPSVSSRTSHAAKGNLEKDANGTSGWRYWGWAYNGPVHTCEDGSTNEACWMNYSTTVGGFSPSDNSANKIYSGGSYSDGTSYTSGRTSEYKIRSVTFPDSNTMQIVWEFKFYQNFPSDSVYIYFHAHDNSGGIGSWHHATEHWTREGTGTWSTRTVVDPNRPPVISSKPATRVKVGQLYRYEIVASDPDGDKLLYSVTTKPSWLTFSGKVLSGTPQDKHKGKHSIAVAVSDGKETTKQAFTITVYTPAPPKPPVPANEPPAVTLLAPDAETVFRGGGNMIVWQASDADGIASIDLHYSLDGETWTAIAENLPGETLEYAWDVSPIISGRYYVRVTATDKNASPLSNTATSPAFSIDNNPEGLNMPQIRGLQPGEGDVIENTTPTISASYSSGDVEIDINSVVMKLDGETVDATVLSSTCHYTPSEPLSSGIHRVELIVRNVNGDEAQRAWSFTVFGDVDPKEQTITTKDVMTIPIIGQVAKPVGIALIICLVVGLIVIGVVVTIKLVRALKKDDETVDLPQYYADYGDGDAQGPEFVEPTSDGPADTALAPETEGSDIVEGTEQPAVDVHHETPSESSVLPSQESLANDVADVGSEQVQPDPFSPNFPTETGPEAEMPPPVEPTSVEPAPVAETPVDAPPQATLSEGSEKDETIGGSDGGF